MPERFSRQAVRTVAFYTIAQGVVVATDRAVTDTTGWETARLVPLAVWAVLLLAGGTLLLAGENYWHLELAGAVTSTFTTTILAVTFAVNAFRFHGAGAQGALSWLLPAALLAQTVVYLGRRR